eukprot:gene8633-34081_t
MMKQKALWRDGRMPREMPVRLYSGRNAYHIFDFIWNRYNCSKGAQSMVRMSSNSPRCVVFSTVPSLVQHIGSVSTLFKDGLNGSNHRKRSYLLMIKKAYGDTMTDDMMTDEMMMR